MLITYYNISYEPAADNVPSNFYYQPAADNVLWNFLSNCCCWCTL